MPAVPLSAVLVTAVAFLVCGASATAETVKAAKAEEKRAEQDSAPRAKRKRINLESSPASRAASATASVRTPPREGLPGFAQNRLFPRVSSSLRPLNKMHDAGAVGRGLHEHALLQKMTQSARRGITRATTRSVRDFLLETTDLERQIDRQLDLVEASIKRGFVRRRETRARSSSAGTATASSREKRRMDVDLGISSFLPRVDFNYALKGGQIDLSLSARGTMNVEGSVKRWPGTRFRAGVNREDRITMSCRIAF